jgi:hypothetical protein
MGAKYTLFQWIWTKTCQVIRIFCEGGMILQDYTMKKNDK